jgi:UTP--glucose-1-phosphate uridylyltransferase
VTRQLRDVYDDYGGSVIGIESIPRENSGSYGVVDGAECKGSLIELSAIVEKPAPQDAPSNLGVVGRYVLTPRIFDHIRRLKPGGGELQLTDAVQSPLFEERKFAHRYSGTRFDCGSKLGYLKATVEFALRHPEVKAEFAQYPRNYVGCWAATSAR